MFIKGVNKLKKLFLVLGIVLFFSLVSCSDDPVDQGNPVTMVELSHLNIVLYEGQSYTVASTVLPLDADDRELMWYSSEPTVCSVQDGEITAHREGISVVTAKTANGKSASLKVDVKKIEDMEAFYMSDFELDLEIGESHKLKPHTRPSSLSSALPVFWSSTNDSVATVDSRGNVTARGNGNCFIFADIADLGRAVCAVSVNGSDHDLSVLADVLIEGLPRTFNRRDPMGNILTTFEVTSYELERTLTTEGVTIVLSLIGTKTYDSRGDDSENAVSLVMEMYTARDEYCTDMILAKTGKVGEEIKLEFAFNARMKQEKREFYVLLKETRGGETE